MNQPANIRHGRIILEFHDDPATPVLVFNRTHTASATYLCAIGTGELVGRFEDLQLTDEEVDWLNSKESVAGEWYNFKRDPEV